MKRTLIATILLGAMSLPAQAADYTAWSGHRSIVLNTSATGANVSETVTNFPILVRLGANEASILSAANNGNSIRFSKADDATPLPYQIESWSADGAAIWVLVDTVYGNNSTQTIRMHWGNASAASESNGAAVFDTAFGFSGVWHMHDSTGGRSTDATPHNTDAVWYNEPLLRRGLIGPAVDTRQPVDFGLEPGNARYLMANYNTDNHNFRANSTSGITLSVWVKRTQNTGGLEQGILGRYNWGQNGRQAMIALNGSDEIRLFRSTNGTNSGNAETNFGTEPIIDGYWYHIVATLRNGQQVLYVNGAQNAAQSTANIGSLDSIWPAKSHLAFGRMAPDHAGNPVHQAFDGLIDEARYARIARSAAWVKLEYENQKVPGTLTDIGLPAVPGAPTGVTATAGTPGSGVVTVSWTAPASDGGADITSYKAMAVGDTLKSCLTVSTLTCSISGLTPGTAYTFVVRAGNAVGAGSLSAASAPVTPPVSLLGGGSLTFNVGGFARPYVFELSESMAHGTERLTLSILDVRGKAIWTKSVVPSESGRTIAWNGRNANGAQAPAGIYFVRATIVTPEGRHEAVQGGVRLKD